MAQDDPELKVSSVMTAPGFIPAQPGAMLVYEKHLEDFHATDEGCQASQALAAAASQAHQQHVASWLTQDTANAAHMLHRKQEHGQIHRPLAHACIPQHAASVLPVNKPE